MSEFLEQALERLKKESAAIKGGKAAIMKGAVREALEPSHGRTRSLHRPSHRADLSWTA